MNLEGDEYRHGLHVVHSSKERGRVMVRTEDLDYMFVLVY